MSTLPERPEEPHEEQITPEMYRATSQLVIAYDENWTETREKFLKITEELGLYDRLSLELQLLHNLCMWYKNRQNFQGVAHMLRNIDAVKWQRENIQRMNTMYHTFPAAEKNPLYNMYLPESTLKIINQIRENLLDIFREDRDKER